MKNKVLKVLFLTRMVPETELFRTPAFIVLGVLPFIAGVLAFLCIFFTEAIFLPLKLDSDSFKNLAELYAVPAAFITIGISLAGLCALNLTSVQTREQIKLSISQNTLSNYFKHAEEFATFLSLKTDLPFAHMSAREHHRQIFPNAMKGDFNVDLKVINTFDSILKAMNAKISDLNESGARGDQLKIPHSYGHPLKELLECTLAMSDFFEMRITHRKVYINPRKPETATGSLFDLFSEAFAIVNILDSFFQFSPEYKQPESLKFFLRIELSKISRERIADVSYAHFIPMREIPF
jgi:hypothetical protein